MRRRRRTEHTERTAPSRRVSITVIVLLAFVCLATGLAAGFVITRPATPPSFTSSTASGTVAVQTSPFDDTRSIKLTVTPGASATVTSPLSGTVTAINCTTGADLTSGSTPLSIDGTPVLALHTTTPLYRTLTSGTRGADAQALNDALRALGYGAPASNTMTWNTITAYNALATSLGARTLTSGNGWAIGPDAFLWLPMSTQRITGCSTATGRQLAQGQDVFTTTTAPVKAALPVDRNGALPGDRTLTIDSQQFLIPADATELTDPALLAAIGASSTYRQAVQGAASGAADPNGGGTANAANVAGSDGTVAVTYDWKLATPLSVITVPPAAVVDAAADHGCVVSHGTAIPVRIVASQLGTTMVSPELSPGADAITSVATHPSPKTSCTGES